MTDIVHVWCTCGHMESWHFEGGACTWLWEGAFETRNCECAHFEVGRVEAIDTTREL
ncbi:hypothetical protein QLQ77_gp60 [Gordonia phage Reyja]|uniref:Uncharacterized protein n=1 Tax=Gordonia phage Reyja TaxID=2571250 RepID=A0A4D6T818_9CAUD|nr:hypothetical protein QLQ77_gp60 [Gordonia phage Reyja]QCG77805.1 hypothetical protein SEA_REYJA_60 [Gordonia phage Reyja]